MEGLAVVTGKRISLSVFFPCHNEAGNLPRVIARAKEILPGISDDFEILIINDGSTDGTGELAEQFAAGDSRIRAVHHERNLGYGGAVQSGIRASRKEWIFYTDGDGQFDLADLGGLTDLTEDYDLIACYRIRRNEGMIRRFNAWAWGRLMRILLGLKVRDIDCAFKLFRRDIFKSIAMKSRGALISAEILARAQRKGYRLVQRGVAHYPRLSGRPTGAKPAVILRAFRELIALRKDILRS